MIFGRTLLTGCAGLGLALLAGRLAAEPPVHLTGTVQDQAGRTLGGASVIVDGSAGTRASTADATGQFAIDYPDGSAGLTLRASARGLESDPMQLAPGAALTGLRVVLHPATVTQAMTVTATRSSLDLPATATTTYVLGPEQLSRYPATVLDDKLRQQAGFELFRRASSHFANPTTEGISLRGLGSTAVSRTLVIEDNVPLNDPFGGWIHWDEIPQDAVESVALATGGGSDLYGSSALGGVIDVVPVRPTLRRLDASQFGGGQDTLLGSMRADVGRGAWRELLAGDSFRTAGYIPTAPSLAGPVDLPANVHYQSARSESAREHGANRVFMVGNMLNEARTNGTRVQTNGTRLWRYIAGDDWSAGTRSSGRARLFGSDQAYRQAFSSVNAARTSESLTRIQHVRTQELGGSADGSFALAPLAFVTGADVRDIRATDYETPISNGTANGVADTSARQRFAGGFAELLGSHGRWSGALSLRLDGAWNLDTRTITQPSAAPLPVLTPNRSEFIASPRLGLVRQIANGASVQASVFRAFRTPTMNELYRTGQVGQETTQANAQLESERATGWDLGAHYAPPRAAVALGATYFWTEINRPVSAVVISTTATSILERRENLGQIVSQGTELHAEIRPGRAVSSTLGYQYAHAVVTHFSAQPALVGNWTAQVPRHSFTAQLRAASKRAGEITLAARASGHAFDDSANTYVLRSFFEIDLAATHQFGTHWTASATIQNLLNQRQDVARTPILTLGSPLLAQGGIAYHWIRGPTH